MNEERDPLISRLALAHNKRSRDIGPARRWKFGEVTGPMCRLAGSHGNDAYIAAAITTQAFLVWHSAKPAIHYGKKDTSLGRALRQVGQAGSYGPRNDTANRVIDKLLEASTPAQLHQAIQTAFITMKKVNHPPHWGLLHQHIQMWMNPTTRNDVRLAWGQDFATPAPTPALVPDTNSN